MRRGFHCPIDEKHSTALPTMDKYEIAHPTGVPAPSWGQSTLLDDLRSFRQFPSYILIELNCLFLIAYSFGAHP